MLKTDRMSVIESEQKIQGMLRSTCLHLYILD